MLIDDSKYGSMNGSMIIPINVNECANEYVNKYANNSFNEYVNKDVNECFNDYVNK